MRYKVLIISFFICLPFWWGVNVIAGNLENLWFLQEITQNPNILNARIDYSIKQLNLSKLRAEQNLIHSLEDLNIEAGSIVIIDLNKDSKIIFEKDFGQTRPIASLTKLMTALVVYDLDETYNLSQIIKLNKESINQEGEYGFKVGDVISVENLLNKMLIESNNDAAYAITQPIGQEAFVDLMNAKAKDIGLINTHFVNSTGLDPDDPLGARNVSTAYDLAKLTNYILKNYSEIFNITTTISSNTNKLLEDYPEIIGGKTGWTPLAGGCLIIVTEKDQKSYISIILGAKDRFAEMSKILDVL